jgi:hypothetical protein
MMFDGSSQSQSFMSFSKQRFQQADRISTAIDDYVHRGKSNASGTAWGCPRVEIRMAELRSFQSSGNDDESNSNNNLSQGLRMDPLRHLRALEAACHAMASEQRPGYDKEGKH